MQVVGLHSKYSLMAAKTSLAQFIQFFNEQKMSILAIVTHSPCQRSSGSVAVKDDFLITALLSSHAMKSTLSNVHFSEF